MAERKTRDPNVGRRVVPAANDEEEKAGNAARSPSADSTSSGGRFVKTASHSRRERQARRRVQPLGEDESEEARDRGVPVPPVGLLPETEEVRCACRKPVSCEQREKNSCMHPCMHMHHHLGSSSPPNLSTHNNSQFIYTHISVPLLESAQACGLATCAVVREGKWSIALILWNLERCWQLREGEGVYNISASVRKRNPPNSSAELLELP